ncbi:MAG: hypothetical protein BHW17_09855 [Dorea sp. 42_8]|nr:MAG: hypothetical protein BHW17_09855 [Dorea sp. 42_8]
MIYPPYCLCIYCIIFCIFLLYIFGKKYKKSQKKLKLNVKFVKDGKITKFVGKMIKKINNTIMQKFIIKISSK